MIKLNVRYVAILGVLLIGLVASAAQSEPVCKSLSECRDLKVKVEEQIKFFLDNAVPTFMAVAVDGNNVPIQLTQPLAVQYCASLNAHLPTAREFAQLAKSDGAAGMLELDYVNLNLDGNVPAGYSLIDATDAVGNSDRFYFNYAGYKVPTSPVEQDWFWSSSTSKNFQDGSFLFFGAAGRLVYGSNMPSAISLVRCVAN